MVNVFFAKTVGRLFLGSVILIGPVEYLLHEGVQKYPELSNAHYNFADTCADNNSTCVPTFVPAGNMCKLPPPQPYVYQLGLNGAKITILSVAFGGIPEDLDQEPLWWKVLLVRCFNFYAWIMVPITMLSTIGHFFFGMGPFETFWHAYECFGILWTLGPWWFNALLVFVKTVFQFSAAGGVSKNTMAFKTILSEPLTSQRDLENNKANAFFTTCLLTIAPYLVVWFPFLLTHVLPGLLIFMPQNVVVMGVMLALSWFISFDPDDNRLPLNPLTSDLSPFAIPAPHGQALANQKKLEKAAGLHVLPLMAFTAILAELLMLEATYLYAGDGWFNTMGEAWLERRTDYYVAAFKQKVLSHFYAVSDLLNEAT